MLTNLHHLSVRSTFTRPADAPFQEGGSTRMARDRLLECELANACQQLFFIRRTDIGFLSISFCTVRSRTHLSDSYQS